jgi:hypothetical protein
MMGGKDEGRVSYPFPESKVFFSYRMVRRRIE